MKQKSGKITETLANGYSSDSTWQALSNEYQQDTVKMIFEIFCFLVTSVKVTSELKGLRTSASYCNIDGCTCVHCVMD